MKYAGSCHCRALAVTLETERAPEDQILGACQCSFCRKHNARAFSDPAARVTIRVDAPGALQLYEFGLATSKQVLCNRCGVYLAMVLIDADRGLSVLNIDTLEQRALFTHAPEPRVYDTETVAERVARRRARWTPTTLVNWPGMG